MRLKYLLVAVSFIGFMVLCGSLLVHRDKDVKLQTLDINSRTIDFKAHQLKGDQLQERLDVELNKDTKDEERVKQLEEENKKYQEETQRLQRELQAKVEAKRLASTVQISPRAAATPSGSCGEWMTAAGVTDMANAAELIRRESGCSPSALNRSSGACGIAQELPCNKSGCGGVGGDPVCQIRWMQGYVVARYGSWAGAVAFHNANNWY